MSTTPFTPLSFTGVSQFSTDLQTILQRAVRIAALPIQKLQLDQTKILAQKKTLGDLGTTLTDLTVSFSALGLLGARGAITASTSNSAVATVQLTGTPDLLNYTLAVTSAASAAQASTALNLADATTTAPRANGLYKLTVGSAVDDFDLLAIGAGRTAGTTGTATPSPPVSVAVTFANGLTGSISANLNSFFVGSAAVSGASAGDTVTVNFTSSDGLIVESVVTDPLAGGESAAAVATALNAKITANANLNGKVSFTSTAGGELKLIKADTYGKGFTFTSSSTGTIVTGLAAGGTVGGHSAEEIATALNAQVALNSTLTAAGVTFSNSGGQVAASAAAGQKFTFTATDSAQSTGFVSGLAGKTRVVGYSNTLNGLRDYINSREAFFGARAAVINTSSDPAAPKYDLSLTATATGSKTLTLLDSTLADLLPAADTLGANAVFSINGGSNITNSSNTITGLVTGLNLTIVGPTAAGATINITVQKDRAAVKTALEDFVVKYNASLDRLNAQIGKNADLAGSSVVRQVHSALRSITGYAATTGSIQSIAALGLESDKNGKFSLNKTTFDLLSDTQFNDTVTFIGSTTTGFAGNAYGRLTQLTDSATGVIKTTQDFFDVSDKRLSDTIAKEQDRVSLLQNSLLGRFSQADALLARLESQQGFLAGLFEAQRTLSRLNR